MKEMSSGFAVVLLFFTTILAMLGGIGSAFILEGIQSAIAALIMVFIISLVTFFSARHATRKRKSSAFEKENS